MKEFPKGLNRRERSVLLAIKQYIMENGYPPTVRELCKLTGYKSTSTVSSTLFELNNKGLIKSKHGQARAIQIVEEVTP